MRYLGFCGLHGAGKTYAAQRLHSISGWPIVDKRAALRVLYDAQWLRTHQDEAWEAWYRLIYERLGSRGVMSKALKEIRVPGEIRILDAIHTPGEWTAVSSLYPNSILIGIYAPKQTRLMRMDEPPEMDVRRVRFWHEDSECLMTQVAWAFPGILYGEVLDSLCRALITYVETT